MFSDEMCVEMALSQKTDVNFVDIVSRLGTFYESMNSVK